MSANIIVVDDNNSVREMLQLYLAELGYGVKCAENGKIALDMLDQFRVDLLITDIKMPVLSGSELIDAVRVRPDAPVIVVLTSHADSDYIVEMMQKGVFDYILKPIKRNDLKSRIERAVRISELRRVERITQKEKVVRLEQQLEWHRFHERLMNRQTEIDNAGLFENLHRSLSQGSGIGTMITLFDILLMTAEKRGDHYEIDGALFEQIKVNNEIVNKAISVFSDVDRVSTDSMENEKVSFLELYSVIGSRVEALSSKSKIRNNRIVLSERKEGWNTIYVNINRDFFVKVVDEVLINALKYAQMGSVVAVLFENDAEEIAISVLNDPREECRDGVPMEYENLVFEPFFRMVKFIQDSYDTLDYGLGLTYVERIIARFNGRVRLYNITDFSDFSSTSVTKVSCKITLPLYK
ncbi:MAG: response regulator [Spirochaetes bacterium]|nr:response regulator [Spirochaetota bacterium]